MRLEDHAVVHGMLITAHAQNWPTRDLVPQPDVIPWRSPCRLTRRINANCQRSHLDVWKDFYVSLRLRDKPGIRRYSAADDDGTTAVSYWPDVAYTPRPHPSLRPSDHLRTTFIHRIFSSTAKRRIPHCTKQAELPGFLRPNQHIITGHFGDDSGKQSAPNNAI